jgi:hypothetical protein
MKDRFEKYACEFKNESSCEEELDEAGIELWDLEKDHFEYEEY